MSDEDIDERLRKWGETGRRSAPDVHLPDFAAHRMYRSVTRTTRGSRRQLGRWHVPLIAAAGVLVVAVTASAVVTHGFGISGTAPAAGPDGMQAASGPAASPHDSGKGATAPAGAGCAPSGDGFSLSPAIDAGGQATPQKAAAYFGEHGDTPGYRAPADAWVQIPDPNLGIEHGVALRAGNVFVHVVKLSDGTWAVDSGGHCTSAPPTTRQHSADLTSSSTMSAPKQAFTGSITLPISSTPGIRSAAVVNGQLVVLAPEYLARISSGSHGRLSIENQANVGQPLGTPQEASWKLVSDGHHLWAIDPTSGARLYRVDPGTLQPGPPILVPEGIVDVAAMDGHLYLNADAGIYDVSPSTAGQVDTTDVITRGGQAMAADPTRHRLLLLRDDGSSIVAYSPVDHELVASHSLPFAARAIAVADGEIWVTGTDNNAASPQPVIVHLDTDTLRPGGHGIVEASLTSAPMVVANGRNLWIRTPSSGDQLWCVWAGSGAQHWEALPGIVVAHARHAFVAHGNVVRQLTLNSSCADQ